MSVKGKKNDEWVAATYTNFGDPCRKETLRRHFTMKAAYKAWEGILRIYGREGHRVWQETRDGEVFTEN